MDREPHWSTDWLLPRGNRRVEIPVLSTCPDLRGRILSLRRVSTEAQLGCQER